MSQFQLNPEWPYQTNFNTDIEVDADVLVIGGGLAGPMAAITAARKGLNVVLVDKGGVRRSGAAGSGIDHYLHCINPASTITAEQLTEARLQSQGGYGNGIAAFIQSKEAYDVLLDVESMGAKVRDTKDVFKGADFRDEKTKLLFAQDYENRYALRVWGSTFKPALYKELKRVGVKLYERVMTTSLLIEGGKKGARVVGATGFDVRTGQFHIFKSKATILCVGRTGARGGVFSAELHGLGGRHGPGLNSGDGFSMAWRAGAELTMMEKSAIVRRHRWTTEGSYTTSWAPCSLVDATGKEVPWVDRDGKTLESVSARSKPAPGQEMILPAGGPPAFQADPVYYRYRSPGPIPDLDQRIAKGEYKLPLYCDFPNMPEDERRVIYGLMIGQEGTTWLSYHNMTRAGFDPDVHQLQVYDEPVKGGGYGWRRLTGGGLMIDWDLKTSLDGLYAAGDVVYSSGAACGALTSGRYAARKAAEYATKANNSDISQEQIQAEKNRVYAPIRRQSGMEWKELDSGIAKVMQHYCGDVKTHERLKIGLKWLDELRDGEGQTLYARNPHELMRSLEVLSLIDWCQVVMHQSLARKSSSTYLNFNRLDYPDIDPPQWRKWITVKQRNGNVVIGERPIDYWDDLTANYAEHCGL